MDEKKEKNVWRGVYKIQNKVTSLEIHLFPYIVVPVA